MLIEDRGQLLAFLPGAGEVRRTHTMLTSSTRQLHVRVLPLFGARCPRPPLRTKPPLQRPAALARLFSTAIAETELTIDGVHVVVDTAWCARARPSAPAHGNRDSTCLCVACLS